MPDWSSSPSRRRASPRQPWTPPRRRAARVLEQRVEKAQSRVAASIAAALAWEEPDIGLLGIKKNADNSVNMAFGLKGKRFLFTGVEVTEDEFTAAMLGKTE